VAAEDVVAQVDCPSAPVSSKDGFAVISADLEQACEVRPAKLKICGVSVAGGSSDLPLKRGTAIKIMTGARIPPGADAVVPVEFTCEQDGWVSFFSEIDPGRNIIDQGYDVAKGKKVIERGEILTPARAGLLAAGGISEVPVYPRPRIGIIATGDELVHPGEPLRSGQLYASNLVALLSWLRHFQMEAEVEITGDNSDILADKIKGLLKRADVLLTSGGAWKSERDLTIRVLQELGGEVVFHRIRMGPGKAVAMVLLNGKTIFCLPGGPPSNEMAFLQIALPGLFRLSGKSSVPFEYRTAILTKAVKGQKDWTQFYYAVINQLNGEYFVGPLQMSSRLQCQASANALIKTPEGIEQLTENEQIPVQLLFDGIH
jgi:molybdopterin molybdotransferase